ncbi:MAG TPA: serine hydrolase domain-containing protein, partial [Coleofasciculaceae cyanobacterium]
IPTPKDYYAKGLISEVHPGTKWAYGNHAFTTIGQLIEDISGEPFSEYMMRHVLEPLGMNHTDYHLSDRVREQLAQGYVFHRGKFKAVDYLEILVTGAGSMFSSVNDMAKYVSVLLNGGSNSSASLLKPETLQLMMQPHYQADPH